MPKPKVLSGPDLLKIMAKFGFEIIAQKGSHIKLRRNLEDATNQILTIPNHKELDKGTTVAIYRQALRFIPDPNLKSTFIINLLMQFNFITL